MSHDQFQPLQVQSEGATPVDGFVLGQFLDDGRVLVVACCRPHVDAPHASVQEAIDCATSWLVSNARQEHYSAGAMPVACAECDGPIGDGQVTVLGMESEHVLHLCPDHRTEPIISSLVSPLL